MQFALCEYPEIYRPEGSRAVFCVKMDVIFIFCRCITALS